MYYKNKIVIAAVIKSFRFIRPEPLQGEGEHCHRVLRWFRFLVSICPVKRVDEARDLCP